MPEQIPTLYVILIVALIVLVGVYLWARKSVKHPEYAARLEAKADAATEDVAKRLEAWGLADAAAQVRKLKEVDLVAAGQAAYATIEPRLNSIEAKVNEILSRLPK